MTSEHTQIKDLFDDFAVLYRNELRRRAAANGIYIGQPPVLNYIREHPGCTQAEIAETLQVSPASIASSTKRLQNSGMIRKQVDAGNMRANKLYISEKGDQAMEEFGKVFDSLNEEMFGAFSAEELETFCGFMERINRILGTKG